VRRAWALVVVAGIAAGCSSHPRASPAPPGGSSGTTSTQPASATAPQTSTTALAGAGTSPVSVPDRTPKAVLTAVRTAHQPGFDRVVLEFRDNAVPGWAVSSKTGQPVQDGSGKPVAVAGQAYLFVRMADAGEADPQTGQIVYTGSTRITPADAVVITEVVATGDFEGVLSWAIGLRTGSPFRVSELKDPARIVIDIQTG
jgi:hypothetical protein